MPPQSIVNSASSEFKVGTIAKQYAILWLHNKDALPFIGFDACHLKGVYGGQLLIAIGIDPNKETWVLAYAVVEMETRESWTWFIDLLAKDVDIVNFHRWAFISDKQKGLPGAFEDIVPNGQTSFCVRHL
ncbi:unnamed protein product [Prunus armeniaca]